MDISVALCSYNGQEYLSDQLDSLVGQTRMPDEIVVLDDNSDDKTWAIIQDYEEMYPEIFDIYQNDSNVGVTKNFEACIRACRGDAIAICDQDDIWCEKKLERQSAHLSLSKPMLVHHNSQIVNKYKDPIQGTWQSFGYSEPDVLAIDEYFDHLIDRFSIPGHTMLLSNQLKEYALPIPGCFAHDQYIALIASLVGELYAMCDRFVYWRHHNETVSTRPALGVADHGLQILQSIIRQSSYEENIEQWEVLEQKVNKFSSDLTGNAQDVRKLLNDRYQYDLSRAKIYNSDSCIKERLAGVLANTYHRRYWRVNGRQPTKLIMKDLIACVIKSIIGGNRYQRGADS